MFNTWRFRTFDFKESGRDVRKIVSPQTDGLRGGNCVGEMADFASANDESAISIADDGGVSTSRYRTK